MFGGFWDIIGDHTGALNPLKGNLPVTPGQPGGYMLVVNAAFTTGEVYRDTIKNVCPNTYYEFSAWVRNICGVCGIDQNSNPTYTPGVYFPIFLIPLMMWIIIQPEIFCTIPSGKSVGLFIKPAQQKHSLESQSKTMQRAEVVMTGCLMTSNWLPVIPTW